MAYPQIADGYLQYSSSGFPKVGGEGRTVLEDFEDQSLSEYGDTTGWQIQGSNVLQGRYSLESTQTNVDIGDSGGDIPTPRNDSPTEYRCRMFQVDEGRAALLVNVQSESNPWANAYSIQVNTIENTISVTRNESGTANLLDTVSGSTHPQTGTEYIAAITTSTDAIKASLYDSSGTLLLETDSISDQTFTGGGLGWDKWEGTTTYFDYATVESGNHGEGSGSRVWIDDFEDGSVGEYTSISGSGTYDATPSAAYRGDYGLEMIGGQDIQSTPGSGLQNYLRSGEEIIFRINFQTLQSSSGTYQQYWVPFCMQDETSSVNRYRLEFLMNGGFRIRKTTSSGTNTVSGSSSEGRDYAALYNVSHSAGSWYSAILLVDETNGLYAELHDAGGNIKGWISSSETEYVGATNGIGWRSSGNGSVYIDHAFEVDQQYIDAVDRSEPIPHSDAPW